MHLLFENQVSVVAFLLSKPEGGHEILQQLNEAQIVDYRRRRLVPLLCANARARHAIHRSFASAAAAAVKFATS